MRGSDEGILARRTDSRVQRDATAFVSPYREDHVTRIRLD